MALTIEDVRHIARLARLRLASEEERRYMEQLSAILEYASRLQQVDTSRISPTATVLSLQAPLREDLARPSTPRPQILASAPESEDGMFRVASVLDREPRSKRAGNER